MTEPGFRTGPVRDVPPPHPVDGAAGSPTPPGEDDGAGLGRAARTVADAVTRLLGTGAAPGSGGARSAAVGVLRDVVGAVAAAAGTLRSPSGESPRAAGEQAPPGAGGDRSPAGVLGDVLAAAAPRLPIRDAERLRAAHPGATDEEIADALVARAARVTSAIGAGVGGLSAAQWFAPPSLLALPLSLCAETVLTAAVEVVLVGELHEVAGRRAAGDPRQRAHAYLAAWSGQRAVDDSGTTLLALLGSAGVRELRRRVSRRLARAIPGAAPFLLGAALSGRANRRSTELLARRIRDDLRQGPRPWDLRG
jgi:hypothetical protein